MISNYISIDRVIEKINRFKIPGGYWNIEEIKEWTYDALGAINDKHSKIKSSCYIELYSNKGKIPAEVESINNVINKDTNKRLELVQPYKDLKENTYLINSGFIYTAMSNPNSVLIVDYYTVPVDENGDPLIPDNRLYISAIEAFLQYMIAKRAFMQGKILANQLQMLEQEWLFYLPAAINSQKMDIMKDPKRFGRLANKFIH